MMATVFIPTPLRQFVDGQDAVHADGATVDEVLLSLVEQHTALNGGDGPCYRAPDRTQRDRVLLDAAK